MAQFEDLPVELVHEITKHLDDLKDINALLQTSSAFHLPCDYALYKRMKEIYERNKEESRNHPNDIVDTKLLEGGPLEWAAKHDNLDSARRLLDAGVGPWPCRDILPPMLAAAKNGSLPMVQLLFNHNPKMAHDTSRWSETGSSMRWIADPLTYAIANHHDSVVEFLVENGSALQKIRRRPAYKVLKPLDQAITVSPNLFAAKLILEKKKQRGELPPADKLICMAAATSFDMFNLAMGAVTPPILQASQFWFKVLDRAFASRDIRTVKFLSEHRVKVDMNGIEDWDPESRDLYVPNNIFATIARVSMSQGELLTFLVQQIISTEDVIRGSSLHALLCTMSAAATTGDEGLFRRLLVADWSEKKPSVSRELWKSLIDQFCISPALAYCQFGIVHIVSTQMPMYAGDYVWRTEWQTPWRGFPD